MRILSVKDIRRLIQQYGLQPFLNALTERMANDFSRWNDFKKSPRHATHYENGVLELMPCSDQTYYSFKYINGHPGNVALGLPSIVSVGMLVEVATGMPVLISEMGIMTALRTAAATALGTRHLARRESHRVGIIGCGAQAEFQLLAIANELPIDRVNYLDIDAGAMTKFSANLKHQDWSMHQARDMDDLLADIDLLVTATAARKRAVLFQTEQISPGMHIHAIGGDCPGKTELPPDLISKATVVVEYLPQTRHEGEMQNSPTDIKVVELHQLINGEHPGRTSAEEITLFDAVGFALEDFSGIMLLHELAQKYEIGESIDMLAIPPDPKDLYGFLFN
ncbi:MAG: ornithine cyclodeaminase [Candidatus Thiodiazotropha sp. (ex Monitilora ramsayi)]|nr:ornithine cyclodeaminase [Candidatus Thiodiazotropha sp. (ex Monitilora ramsayi)]